ncbi:MAG: mechanosensitive ion channel family protein [Sphingopyxis sp.]
MITGTGASALAAIERVTQVTRAIGIDVGAYRLSLYSFVSTILLTVFLYFVVRVALRSIRWVLRRNSHIDAAQRLLVEKVLGITLYGLAAMVGIDLLGIDLTALAVFSGAMGLAIGFGLQKTIGNLIAGIILLMDRSIKPGDVIVVGDGASMTPGAGAVATVGRVARIGVRAVSVVTRDGKKHLIPNELLMTQPVENWSYFNRDVRVRMRVPVPYDCDLRFAQSLMIKAATGNPRVLAQPEPTVWVTGFGERAVDHELRLWISDPEAGLGNVQGEIFMAIWDAFRAEGIALPYPRFDVAFRPAGPDSSAGLTAI